MTTLTTTTRLAAPVLLALATAFTLTACLPAESACAAIAMVVTPPEPIEDGTYRDGSHNDSEEVPPEPIEDGSYRDGSEQETEQDESPPEPIENDHGKPRDDAKDC